MNQEKIDKLFMDIAIRISKESYCKRKKVGAILVKNNSQIISMGFNGTPSGEENCCEEIENVTKSNVIHAEDNVYRKLLKSSENSLGSTLYCTLQPCERCSEIIIDSGTSRVVFLELYRIDDGVRKLKKQGIEVIQYKRIKETTNEGNTIY